MAMMRSSAADHAEIPVARLARVQEEGGRSRAGQGRGNLVADMTRLAHAGHHYLAATAQHHLAGALERLVKVLVESINGLFFYVQHRSGAATEIEQFRHFFRLYRHKGTAPGRNLLRDYKKVCRDKRIGCGMGGH